MSKIAMECRPIRSNSVNDDSDSSSDGSSCNFRGFRDHSDDENEIAFDSSRDNCIRNDSQISKRSRNFCYHSRDEFASSFWESEDSSPTQINSKNDATPEMCSSFQQRMRFHNVNYISSSKSNQIPTRKDLDYLSFPLFTVCIMHNYKIEDKNKGKDNDEDFQRRDSITTLTSCSFEDISDDDSLHSFCTSASESEDDSDEEILNIPLPSIQSK